MINYNYKLNCGQYVLHEGETPIGPVLDEISLCFDRESGTLHKHGSPELVDGWYQKTQAKFRKAGFDDMAASIVVVTGRFELAELNKCLSTSGYVARLYERIAEGAAEEEPLSAALTCNFNHQRK